MPTDDPWQAQLEALGEFIRSQRKMAQLSLRELAERTHVSNPYLSQIERAGLQVRVLEPSPPAVDEPPWFADDPVAGGDVVPVERPGDTSTTWADVSAGDPALRAWCEDRWLVRRTPLVEPLPPNFVET